MAKQPKVVQLLTVGLIAEKLGVEIHRVNYILRTRDYIKPSARAGIYRLYDNEALKEIEYHLYGIEQNKP